MAARLANELHDLIDQLQPPPAGELVVVAKR